MPYLAIKKVKKQFNKVEVLKGIDLEIEKGEFICFLGPSGCGKTTLLRIIAGLEKLDSGNILINERDNNFGTFSEKFKYGISILCSLSKYDSI